MFRLFFFWAVCAAALTGLGIPEETAWTLAVLGAVALTVTSYAILSVGRIVETQAGTRRALQAQGLQDGTDGFSGYGPAGGES